MDFLMESLRPLSPLLGYVIIRVAEVATSLWTWTALISITFFSLWRFRGIRGFHFCFLCWEKHAHMRVTLQSFSASNNISAGKNSTAFADDNRRLCRNMCMDDFHVFRYAGESLMERGIYTRRSRKRNKSSSTIDSLTLCNSLEAMGNCTEANSACFLETKMMFIVEKSSSFSASRSVPLPSPSRFRKMGLESRKSDQQLDYRPPSLIRLPMHDKHCPADKYEEKECRSVEEPMQKCKGKITFSSDFLYNVEKCRGGSFFMNDVEVGRPLGPCLLDNCVGLLLWRRLGSFETQFGWDRLQSLRLGYDWNWNCNCCTGGSGLNFDNFSKYLVPDIQVTSTIDNTVLLWDIEVGKCLNKMMVNDYTIVGRHIENSSGFLLNSFMIRDVEASLLLWDRRDFHRPLNFCVGKMSRFQSVQFNDNKFCVSDCYNDRLFDLRMMAVSSSDSSMRSKAVFSYD